MEIKWKLRLKSGNESITLLNLENADEVDEFGRKITELFFDAGDVAYYMSTPRINKYIERPQEFDRICYKYISNDKKENSEVKSYFLQMIQLSKNSKFV